jgi:hypothetical protein
MEVKARQNDRLWMHVGACWRLRNALVADCIANNLDTDKSLYAFAVKPSISIAALERF